MITASLTPDIVDKGRQASIAAVDYLMANASPRDGFQATVQNVPDVLAKFRQLEGGELFTSAVVLYLLNELAPDLPTQPKVRSCVDLLSQVLLPYAEKSRVNYFRQAGSFPPDVDTTAIVFLSLEGAGAVDKPKVRKAALEILGNSDSMGVTTVYWDKGDRAGRYDPVAATNALHLIHKAELHDDPRARATEAYAFRILTEDKHINGSRYYPSAAAHVFFATALVCASTDAASKWRPLVLEKAGNLAGNCASPIQLAMYVSSLRKLGWAAPRETELLLGMQQNDGGWPYDHLYGNARTTPKICFGSRALVTAFALHALNSAPSL